MACGGKEWKVDLALGLLTPQKEAAARNRGWREGHRVAYVVSLVLVFPRIPWKGEEGNSGRGAQLETARRGPAAWPELKVPSDSR